MFASSAVLVVLTLLSGAARRLGLAGSLGLFAGFMTAFANGQPTGDDWRAAGVIALLVLIVVRVARSWGRSQRAVRIGIRRELMTSRAVHRGPWAWLFEPAADKPDSELFGESVDDAATTARRPACERRGWA